MFKHVFFVIMDLENVWLNLKIIGFVPYNLKKIIGILNFKFYTFIFLNFHSMNFAFINLNMFCTAKDVVWNFVNLKFKIVMHWNNLFNYSYELIDMQIKNVLKLIHKMVLFEIENKIFCTANEFFSKWKKIKKTHVQIEWLFNIWKMNAL